MIAKILFFTSLAMIFYVYLGYPLLIGVIGKIRNRRINKSGIEPEVTILIAAYNEEENIGSTLKNKLELGYPKDRLEIIVISDGSTDNTDEIVKRYESEKVRLIRQEPRAGKTSALNLAVPEAMGQIVLFSDANSLWDPHALRSLVANFADPEVGYVTGKMIYVNPDGNPTGDGCTAYMRYENFLRRVETRAGSVVGVDGGIDAVRKELYRPMNQDQLPDFVLPMKVIDQGYRVVYEPKAILKEATLKDASDEYRMRVRVALRSFWALRDMRHLLTFTRSLSISNDPTSHLPNFPTFLSYSNGSTSHPPNFTSSFLYSWQLWSHKVLRYLCFVFLIGAYLTNLYLYNQGLFYKLLFVFQTAAYLAALLAPILEKQNIRISLIRLCHYFVLINIASAHAFIKFLLGKKQVMWTPRKG